MRCLQKLCRCGNSTHFAIPRPALFWLGWLPGEQVIFELLEDKSIRVRKPTSDDFAAKGAASIKLETSMPMPT
jgi:antitoxin component of MazEF toxin-antitoxin module